MNDWEKALDYFCVKARESHIDFCLIGSVTASIRGVNIIPHDIDIIVNVKDFWKARDAFKDNIFKPFAEYAEGVVNYFGKILVNDVVIDISAKPHNMYGRHTIEMLCWNGHIIKSQTLELLQKVYQKNNRLEYSKAIDEYFASMAI